MKSLDALAVILVTSAIGGCAAPSYVDRTTDSLKPLLAAGKFDVALALSRNDIAADGAAGVAFRKELAAYPGISYSYKSRLLAEINVQSEAVALDSIAYSVKLGQRDGVLTEADAMEVLQAIAKRLDTIARTLHVPSHVWTAMSGAQLELLRVKYVADQVPANSYGTIIDAQSLNESTPGSNAGSELGAAIGQAAYIDNAFKGNTWNYSAKNQLAAGIVGAMVGSLANTAPRAQFRTRYTIKLGNGQIEYIEETKSEPFRHTVGLCVALLPIRLIEQTFCTITKEAFLSKFVAQESSQASDGKPNSDANVQPPELIRQAGRQNTQNTDSPRAELAIGDVAWNEGGPVVGYVAPSVDAKVDRQIGKGTTFQVQVVLKDWAKVRLANGATVWIEKRNLSWANSKG